MCDLDPIVDPNHCRRPQEVVGEISKPEVDRDQVLQKFLWGSYSLKATHANQSREYLHQVLATELNAAAVAEM